MTKIKKQGKANKRGIIIGAVAACTAIGILAPSKDIESITLSIPSYQAEYDINTEIPVNISVVPDDANSDSIEYITSSDSVYFSDSKINTGTVEGTYELYVVSNDVKSNTLVIDVVDISAREEAEKRVEEERLAKEMEEQKAAEEQATSDAEEMAAKEVEEKAAKEAEEKAAKEAEEKAAKEAEEKAAKEAEEKAAKEAEEKIVQNETTQSNSNGSGNVENFNTYDNEEQQNTSANYVLNMGTNKFHIPTCKSVKKIAPQNYATSNGTRDDVIAQGYDPCGICTP